MAPSPACDPPVTHNGEVHPPSADPATSEPSGTKTAGGRDEGVAAERGQRRHIMDTALRLMAQRGMAGTSMRDLAGAAGLNVASLYHYFPSKRDLLVAVLEERGYFNEMAGAWAAEVDANSAEALEHLLGGLLTSMLEVEEFIRLMLGEAIRGDETALTVGTELMANTLTLLEHSLKDLHPALCDEVGVTAAARMLRALVIGTFVEHVVGVMEQADGDSDSDGDGDGEGERAGDSAAAGRRAGGDPAAALRQRAVDAAKVLQVPRRP